MAASCSAAALAHGGNSVAHVYRLCPSVSGPFNCCPGTLMYDFVGGCEELQRKSASPPRTFAARS